MKSFLYAIILTFSICLVVPKPELQAQGCVAVRNMASTCSLAFDSLEHRTPWQLSINYRYFRSFRHFRGDHEETQRVENGTEVINNDNSVLFAPSYTLNKRWSFAAVIPLLYIDRSSLYEHKGNNSGERYHTHSQGLGDIRVSAYYAVIPETVKGNLTFGLGLKLPTGNYHYKDYFHKPEGLELKYVDQSIQPGDGGLGVIAEVGYNQLIAKNFYGYVTGLYMFNPRNTNGVQRSQNLSNAIPLSNEFSVADQFLFRLGGRYVIKNFQVGLGGRIEGIPAKDAIGDSDGFRRPGHIISVEPAAIYTLHNKHTFGISVPVALYRNRTKNTIDIQSTEITGKDVHGDAAFSDWLLSVFYSVRF
ncbi:MAG TPA: hypothetical protein VFW11_00220 [Cyclobacteriaceae bacterium]|nr:hypothetical protein [Cyclobacteriaceae bacterium]